MLARLSAFFLTSLLMVLLLGEYMIDSPLFDAVTSLQYACLVVIAALILLPDSRSENQLLLPLCSLAAGIVYIVATQFYSGSRMPPLLTLQIAAGIALLLFALAKFLVWLENLRQDQVNGRLAGYLVIVGLALAPLWLGPFVALQPERQWLADTVVAVSPLSYLSVLTGIDYLRQDWFYQHAPFGGLRYDYLALGWYLLILLLPPLWQIVGVCRRAMQARNELLSRQ